MAGRPQHVPTEESRKLVSDTAKVGVREDCIAGLIGIDPKTLRKHYRKELDHAFSAANVAISNSLYNKAMGDGPQAVAAIKWWDVSRGGFRETFVNEHVGRDGGPIMTMDLSKLSDEQINVLEALIGPLTVPSGDADDYDTDGEEKA